MKPNTLIKLTHILPCLLHATPESTSNTEKTEPPSAEVCFIAIGQTPPRRYIRPTKSTNTTQNSRPPVLMDTPKGSTPPQRLFYRLKKQPLWENFKVNFNNQGAFHTIPSKTNLHFHTNSSDAFPRPAYLSVPKLEPNSQTLVVMSQPTIHSGGWNSKPEVTFITMTRPKLDHTRIVFTNTSDSQVLIELTKGSPFIVQPRQNKTIEFPNSLEKKATITLRAKAKHDEKPALLEHIHSSSDFSVELAKSYEEEASAEPMAEMQLNFAPMRELSTQWLGLMVEHGAELMGETEKENFLEMKPVLDGILEATADWDHVRVQSMQEGNDIHGTIHFKTK